MSQVFRDFNLNFEPHPLTGDISIVTGEAAVIQSMKNILLTFRFERPFQPFLHGSVQQLLFENKSDVVLEALRRQIQQVLAEREPRIENLDVRILRGFANGVVLKVFFRTKASTESQSTQIVLQRDT